MVWTLTGKLLDITWEIGGKTLETKGSFILSIHILSEKPPASVHIRMYLVIAVQSLSHVQLCDPHIL